MRSLHTEHDLAPFHAGRFIPTMGALHQGHEALIHAAAADNARTFPRAPRAPIIVSIFVNPTQFNDPADLTRYPRTLAADLAICQAAGADAVFIPEPAAIYPLTDPIPVPALPRVATAPALEDAFRPGHFAGVCQVVQRLFDLVRPAHAYFGEKDWQQLQVILAMAAARPGSPAIVPVPTIREPDGLALSSRNRFIPPADRTRALAIAQALRAAQEHADPHAAERAMRDTLQRASLQIDYAVIRDAQTLEALDTPHRAAAPNSASAARPARALIAARLAPIRLIDNAPWPRTP